MHPETVQALLDLNRRFYAEYGPAFAATRRRIQPGVWRILADLPDRGRWLDLGCGSGPLAVEWLRTGRTSAYLGLDFSAELLAEARKAIQSLPGAVAGLSGAGQVAFALVDLADLDWAARAPGLAEGSFDGALSFAVFHHLPSHALRLAALQKVRALLAPGGRFYHSEWQFQHSPKLMGRRVPWEQAGILASALEPGDTLLDWRYRLPGGPEQAGLRYVHLFSREELAALASEAGFRVVAEFESDGQGGRLGLYQAWERNE